MFKLVRNHISLQKYGANIWNSFLNQVRHSQVSSSQTDEETAVAEQAQTPPPPLKPINQVNLNAVRLKTRSVVAIQGPGSFEYLERLTTNSMLLLDGELSSVYTYFLNLHGRVIHDAIVYKISNEEYLVESDTASIQALQVHLLMMRGKENVRIKSVEHEVAVWTVYNPLEVCSYLPQEEGAEDNSKNDTTFLEDIELGEDILMSRDPRMWPLGMRILAPKDLNILSTLKANRLKASMSSADEHKLIRYKLGISEGVNETYFGRCYPEELNGDYINGIASTKVSYVGSQNRKKNQVIENRMIPVKLDRPEANIAHPLNAPITDIQGKRRTPIGFLRGMFKGFGIALVNLSLANKEVRCKINNLPGKFQKLPWGKKSTEEKREQQQ